MISTGSVGPEGMKVIRSPERKVTINTLHKCTSIRYGVGTTRVSSAIPVGIGRIAKYHQTESCRKWVGTLLNGSGENNGSKGCCKDGELDRLHFGLYLLSRWLSSRRPGLGWTGQLNEMLREGDMQVSLYTLIISPRDCFWRLFSRSVSQLSAGSGPDFGIPSLLSLAELIYISGVTLRERVRVVNSYL